MKCGPRLKPHLICCKCIYGKGGRAEIGVLSLIYMCIYVPRCMCGCVCVSFHLYFHEGMFYSKDTGERKILRGQFATFTSKGGDSAM